MMTPTAFTDMPMLLEMICTGEEVLSGQIVDTNAAWFADTMFDLGIEMQQRITVGDRLQDLCRVFSERSRHADVILVNGGLGPTSDDLSAEAMALAAGVNLVENRQWRDHLMDWFTRRGRAMPASNFKQCLLPETAILIDNPVGSAPGFRIKLNRAWLFFTPGVPSEFKQMVTEQFVPFVQATFRNQEPTQLAKFLTFGHGESTLADQISHLPLPGGITIGYRSSIPHVEIKVFARGAEAIAELEEFLPVLRASLGTAFVSEHYSSIAEEVHGLLLGGGHTLSMAESCTGGMLASQLVEYPGSSGYFQHSLVTYANEAKSTLLGVTAATLQNHGAVSMETAIEMATGARKLLDSDFSLATSGIAGPEGGSADKPVGTVAIALCDREHTWVQLISLGQRSRTMIRLMSCAVALDMLRRRLLNTDPIVHYPFIPAMATCVEQTH
jgi:nicotinamide-nucleotide amidase